MTYIPAARALRIPAATCSPASKMPLFGCGGMATHISSIELEPSLQFKVVTDPTDTDDPVSAGLRAGVFPVPALFDLMRRVVPAGGRVVDLGAHVGSFTLAAAAAGYAVLSVEASPQNAALLRESIAINGFRNVMLVNAAVSDKPGRLRFHSQGPYGFVAPGADESFATEVEAVTVDDLLQRSGWSGADFIKLDIEGSEVAAIRGMARTMGGSNRPVLFCESNGHMLDYFGESPNTLKAALMACGCKVYLVQPGRLIQVTAEEPQGQTVVDCLAVGQLPTALAALRVEPATSQEEVLGWLHEAASSAALPERLYAARVVRDMSASMRAHPEMRAIRAMLARDADAAVRAIVEAVRVGPEALSAGTAAKKSWWSKLTRG